MASRLGPWGPWKIFLAAVFMLFQTTFIVTAFYYVFLAATNNSRPGPRAGLDTYSKILCLGCLLPQHLI